MHSRIAHSSIRSFRSTVHTASLIHMVPQMRHRSDRLVEVMRQQLDEIRHAGTYKEERVITSPQESAIRVRTPHDDVAGKDAEVLNFCANNYLGLSNHPELVKAAKDTLDSHGLGMSSVRFICGTQDIHKELEKRISEFHGTEDSILFPSCFDANAGLFEALLTEEDAILSDELNHASIIDGIRLCKAQRHRYKHLDMKDLEAKLQATEGARLRMIATDGIFSMDGDIAPLDKIVALAEKYDNVVIFIDECHATGFIGKTGRGTPELFGVEDKIDIINSTLGKALGGATGGYTAARKEVIDILRQKARPYLFSNSIAPALVGAALKTLEVIQRDSSPLEQLKSNVHLFRTELTKAGFQLSGHDECPIAPVWLGDARLAAEFADDLLERGIYVIGFSYPVVPKGKARIRVQLSAAHTTEQVQKCIDAFIDIGKKKGVLKQ